MTFLTDIDQRLFFLINGRWISPALDRFMVLATNQETGILIILAILVAFSVLGRRKGRIASLSAVLAYAFIDPVGHYIIKPLFARPRPCHLEIGRLLVDCGSGLAMPSLHSAASWGVFTAIVAFFGAPALPLFILAIIVGYSRVYVGVHWPFDVIVGAVYGAGIGLLAATILKKFFMKEKNAQKA